MLSGERGRAANPSGIEASLSKRNARVGLPHPSASLGVRNDTPALLFLAMCSRAVHPPKFHVALLAHVAGFAVLVQSVFRDLSTHFQLVQLVASVWHVAAEARHFFTRKWVPRSAHRVPRIGMTDAMIFGEFDGRHVARSVSCLALQVAVQADIISPSPAANRETAKHGDCGSACTYLTHKESAGAAPAPTDDTRYNRPILSAARRRSSRQRDFRPCGRRCTRLAPRGERSLRRRGPRGIQGN